MRITITKDRDQDLLAAYRPDGTVEHTTFPKKGCFPHDLVHFIVESELGYITAFWGRVAAGMAPAAVGRIAKAGGHHSASRAEQPDENIIQLIQAERIVECFEAELWAAPADLATFRSVLAAACVQSAVNSPVITDQNINRIRAALAGWSERWQQLAAGESVTLHWVSAAET